MKIIRKTLDNDWQYGCIGSFHKIMIDGTSYEVPKGIKKIMDILDDNQSDDAKKTAIKEITSDRKGIRGATFFSLRLSKRSDDTRQTYEDLDNLLEEDQNSPSHRPSSSSSN